MLRTSSVQRRFSDLACIVGAIGLAFAILNPAFAATPPQPATSAPAPSPAPTRIAALAPSLTELVFAAGAGDKLVAVSTYSDFPEAAKNIPQVSAFAGVNMESLIKHRPDLVLVWPTGTRDADIASMRKLGMRVEAVGINMLSDVPDALRRIGKLTGTDVVADREASAFAVRLVELNGKSAGTAKTQPSHAPQPLRVFIEIGRMPLMSVNGNHFISDAVTRCGGVNVFADVAQLVFEPSREALLKKNPQLIIRPASRQRVNDTDLSAYRGTDAARLQQVALVNADHLLRPGPRLIDAAEAICAAIAKITNR